tara:strand:+ start:590 stop:841 length:252 start_codon:yes stop_codon:yes gene_type:complete
MGLWQDWTQSKPRKIAPTPWKTYDQQAAEDAAWSKEYDRKAAIRAAKRHKAKQLKAPAGIGGGQVGRIGAPLAKNGVVGHRVK